MSATPRPSPITLGDLNGMEMSEALRLCGGFFEHSPWIVEAALAERPFATLRAFHAACLGVVERAPEERRLALIAAHPDLVGRLAREGTLGRESTSEQAAAGLDDLGDDEVEAFERYNGAYRERFGFPFVICARNNRKEAILKAFPLRLTNDRATEIRTALGEIGEIAWLRMTDAVKEDEHGSPDR